MYITKKDGNAILTIFNLFDKTQAKHSPQTWTESRWTVKKKKTIIKM